MPRPRLAPELRPTIELGGQRYDTEMLYSGGAIHDRVAALGRTVASRYTTKGLEVLPRFQRDSKRGAVHVIGIMTGAMYFAPQLCSAIRDADDSIAITYDQMQMSTYTGNRSRGGVIRSRGGPNIDIEGKNVLIADNLIDSGLTLSWLTKILSDYDPASIAVAAAFQMAPREELAPLVGCRAVYSGFQIAPEQTVVGYGSDYLEQLRELSGLYRIEQRAA